MVRSVPNRPSTEDRNPKRKADEPKRAQKQRSEKRYTKRHQREKELKSKEDSGGLSDTEKSELEKVRKRRHEAKTKLDERKQDRDKTRKTRRVSSKREALKKHPKVQDNPALKAELKTHAERVARLNRARNVAEADGNTELVSRIDKALAAENKRHATAAAKLKAGSQ